MKNTQTRAAIKCCFIKKSTSIQTSKRYLLHHFMCGINSIVAGFYFISRHHLIKYGIHLVKFQIKMLIPFFYIHIQYIDLQYLNEDCVEPKNLYAYLRLNTQTLLFSIEFGVYKAK